MQHDITVVEVVNRTTKPLNYVFDGQPGTIPPSYKFTDAGKVIPAGRDLQPLVTHLPKTIAEYARRQNVKRGTEDKDTGEATFLVGVGMRLDDGTLIADPHWLMNEIGYTEQGTSVERFDRSKLDARARKGVEVEGSGFPKGRLGAGEGPMQYNDGPVTTDRGA